MTVPRRAQGECRARRWHSAQAILEMIQYFDLGAFQRFLRAVGKAHQKIFTFHHRCGCDHAHRATQMHQRRIRPARFHELKDPGPSGDAIRLV